MGEPNRFCETIPCKIAALNFPDEVTDRAREIGPTNKARAYRRLLLARR